MTHNRGREISFWICIVNTTLVVREHSDDSYPMQGEKIFLNLQCKQDIGGNITFHVCMYYSQTSSNTNWDRYHSWNWSRVCEHFFSKIQYTLKSNDNREEIWCTLFGYRLFSKHEFILLLLYNPNSFGYRLFCRSQCDHSDHSIYGKSWHVFTKIYKRIHGTKEFFLFYHCWRVHADIRYTHKYVNF